MLWRLFSEVNQVMQLEIKIVEGQKSRTTGVSKQVITIGRSPGCDIVLSNDVVSGRHAKLRIYREYAVIEDLGSSNGILVDGKKISRETEIFSESRIQIGKGGPIVQLTGLPDASQRSSVAYATETRMSSQKKTGRQKQSSGSGSMMMYTALGGGALLLVAASLICVMTGGYLFFSETNVLDRNLVQKIEGNDDQLSNAVGLVIIGFDGIDGNGNKAFAAYSTGTGFCVTPDGYVFTNKHVVESYLDFEKNGRLPYGKTKSGARDYLTKSRNPYQMRIFGVNVWVVLNGKASVAELIHVSRKYDFCILKIPQNNLPYFRISSSSEVNRAADVFALGFPAESRVGLSVQEHMQSRLKKSSQPSIEQCFKKRDFLYVSTNGTVSRGVSDETVNIHWIQHTADIHKGNSGGPLCTKNGTVVGVNTRFNNRPEANTNPVPTYYSFSLSQLKSEIEKHIPNIRWGKP